MDVNILDGIFNYLTCPECYEVETLHLNDTNAKKKGPARLIYLKCNSCTCVKEFGVTKRLTNSKIDILQNYFGIALRQNIIWRI